MKKEAKSQQLQIRVSPEEKAAIRRMAKRAGVGISEWVMAKLLPSVQEEFQQLVAAVKGGEKSKYHLAELNDFLGQLTSAEFHPAVSEPPSEKMNSYFRNYVTAMVELAAYQKGLAVPEWTEDVPALEEPVFGTDLESLRLHLLLNAPPPFRRRNIFIDSSVGDRV